MRIKFLKGKVYNGVPYGPGYPESEVDVPEKVARHYLHVGCAIVVEAVELPPVPSLSTHSLADVVESRDPKAPRKGKR